ncbi:MAG TPA: hypothetical protein VGN32_11350 [Ktedonobacterales bacterium]|jgi:predicted tellurium resistance membrane protein TerC|nr:hypothetical protein [Ktedonobacterales bacterium]
MKGAAYGLLGIGIIVAILGLVNHYALHLNPIGHFSTILIAVGAVLAVVGIAMTVMGGRGSAA